MPKWGSTWRRVPSPPSSGACPQAPDEAKAGLLLLPIERQAEALLPAVGDDDDLVEHPLAACATVLLRQRNSWANE